MAGDIFSFRLFGQAIVILNTPKATKDLLERRSDIYSDRPAIPIYEMYESCVQHARLDPDTTQDEVELARGVCRIHRILASRSQAA